MKKYETAFLVLLGLTFLFGTAFAQQRGGTLVFGGEADALGLDPHTEEAYSSMVVYDQIYNSLLTTDATLNIGPELAESWEVSEGGLVLTLWIREGVRFHNGREMAAEDVAYSLNRILDPATASTRATELGPIQEINVLDSYTIELVLSEPFAPLLTSLSEVWCAVVPREVVEEHGDLKLVAVGTGPFMLSEWVREDHITLVRNPNYWEEGLPYLDELVIKPMPDTVSRITALTTGIVDVIMGVPARETPRLESLPNVKTFGGAGTLFTYLGMFPNKAPFDNVKVRQAIAMAIDRTAVLDLAWDGSGRVSTCGPLGTNFWWGCDDVIFPPEGNIEEARQLLVAAGYPEGFKTTLKVPADYSFHVAEGQLCQAALEAIGIEVEYIGQEWGAHVQDKSSGNMEMYIGGWIGFTDPNSLFYSIFHTDGSFNANGWSDPEIDVLLELGRAEMNQQARAEIYHVVNRLLTERVAYVFLCNAGRYGALLSPKIGGFEWYANDRMLALKRTWIEQ
jgi:peptide/nickel transport system substrate-binding protein